MAMASCPGSFRSFNCRCDPDFSRPDIPSSGRNLSCKSIHPRPLSAHGISSLIFKFPPNFVRRLSAKARRNRSNIGVAQVAAASLSNNQSTPPPPVAKAVDGAATAVPPGIEELADLVENGGCNADSVQFDGLTSFKHASFLNSDGSIAIHAGERLGRDIVTDALTTPVVNTSAYFFRKTSELIDFKYMKLDGTQEVADPSSKKPPIWTEKRRASFEYGRHGNYTTLVAEEKISALEGAESTIFMASGMCVSTVMLMALVPAGGHIVTTTDCYRKTRIFIETVLPKMGISATVIDPADIGALESALENNKVTLFFTESPTNPFLRCVDIELVSNLCHEKGALVCIDGTFATPINQKAPTLGADIVVHSATKFIGGHNDVLAGCISGPEKLISVVRNYHNILGGALNPNAAYLIIRGLKTLHLRVQQQNTTALRMAEILEEHPKIRHVYYPGLASHPEHQLAKKQMKGCGGVVSFEVDGDLLTTAKFIDSLKIPYIAPSFGGCESIIDQPAIMSYWDLSQSERAKYGIMDNLVRFSFGVEDFEDLKVDILQALEKI